MQTSYPAVLFSGRKLLRLLFVLVCCSLLAKSSGAVPADQIEELVKRAGMRILEEGNSSAAAHKAAQAAFPLQSLSAEKRSRAEQVLSRCTQYRRLPRLQYTIDEPLYRYLLEHPDVAVSTWRAMGISQFQMWQTGPLEYEAAATDGSEGIADILYRDADEIVFICEGSYHNLLLPAPLEASALIWFRAEYKPHADGTHIVTQSADAFVHFPSAGVAGIAKVLTPVTSSLMDRNLYEVSLYASMMSRAVRDEPEWIVDMSSGLEGVLPQRRTELAAVARQPRHAQQSKSATQPQRFVDRWVLQSAETGQAAPPEGNAFGTQSAPPESPIALPSLSPSVRPTSSPTRREANSSASPLIPRTSRRSPQR
ncbi:MAG: hypothetical protein RLZZ436_4287 [Planctomycetota bacterium]|jgi:hypothetical protein